MRCGLSLAVTGVLVVGGCASWAWGPAPSAPALPALPVAAPLVENPLFLAAVDRDFLWNELAATVESYGFRIEREERPRQIGDVLVEGRLETFPVDSPTLFEPWRRGASPGFERLESTLQSIRRRAVVRVIPDASGFLVDVAVFKELEDVQRPERATAGAATFRNDSSLERFTEPVAGEAPTRGWISRGRDTVLEQEIIAELQARMGQACAPPPSMLGWEG